MSNSAGKKYALLLTRDYLINETDEDHSVTSADIIKMLEKHGISSDRSLIYRDIAMLRDDYGMDINLDGRKYYVASRDFELEEIKLLVDMVQSSNFITAKKSNTIISKLIRQVSIYQGLDLNRKIYIRSRVKNTNESVFIIIDKISNAISKDRKISFQYFSYNLKKEKELRHGGKFHIISPFALIWVDQNYYMLGYDSEHKELRHYRIDRMTNVSSVNELREGKALFERTDMSTYTENTFHMFRGVEQSVTLRCKNYVVDSIIDRFGDEIMIIPDGKEYFNVTLRIQVSTQFYAWLSPFGKDIEIIRPASVRNDMLNHFKEICSLYE